MPKIPDDMSAAAIKKRAAATLEMKARVQEMPVADTKPKIRIAKKR
ncbi:MAG TPA: hypothetical protein VHZ32_12230 [Rhizomicrobium sp.]|jgi:hypothetical protein|nr:hypothetical protein [Rhizomicrobium sp.]